MKLFLIALFVFFTGICIAEDLERGFQEGLDHEEPYTAEEVSWEEFEKESADYQKTVFEDSDCDSCFIEADHPFPLPFPFPFPLPPPQFPPLHWFPPPPHCVYGAGEVCHTINGNMCYTFILNYPFMTHWISSCIEVWPIFRACQLSVSVPISSGCYPTGTPCLCGFPGYHEAGYIF